jgi:hypothetical protein
LNYQPKPIDTSKVTLTAEYLKLTELLAKNTHELWAQQRLSEGWKYGSQRDDVRKEHPCLVPYEDLPESEKQYDRITTLGVLKTVLALGYRIEGNRTAFENPSSIEDNDLVVVLQSLKDSSELNLSSLLALQRETINLQPRTPDIYRVLGDSILQLGEPLMAYDVIAEGLKHWQTVRSLSVHRKRRSHLIEHTNPLGESLTTTFSKVPEVSVEFLLILCWGQNQRQYLHPRIVSLDKRLQKGETASRFQSKQSECLQ